MGRTIHEWAAAAAGSRQTVGELSLSPSCLAPIYLPLPPLLPLRLPLSPSVASSSLSISPPAPAVSSDKSLTHCFLPPLSLPISLLLLLTLSAAPVYSLVSIALSPSLPPSVPSPLVSCSPLSSFLSFFFSYPFDILTALLISSFPLFLAHSPPAGLFSRLSSAVAAVLLIQLYSFKWPKSSLWRNLIRTLIAFFSLCLSLFLFMCTDIHKYALLIDLWELASSFFCTTFILFLSLCSLYSSYINIGSKPAGFFQDYFSSLSTIFFVSPDHSRTGLACSWR